jgi:hypothetical protein
MRSEYENAPTRMVGDGQLLLSELGEVAAQNGHGPYASRGSTFPQPAGEISGSTLPVSAHRACPPHRGRPARSTGAAEERHRADKLVVPLFWPRAQELDLLIAVDRYPILLSRRAGVTVLTPALLLPRL